MELTVTNQHAHQETPILYVTQAQHCLVLQCAKGVWNFKRHHVLRQVRLKVQIGERGALSPKCTHQPDSASPTGVMELELEYCHSLMDGT